MTKTGTKPFQVFVKPSGAACNLACTYCYYIHRQCSGTALKRMPDDILVEYIMQHLKYQGEKTSFFSWHGGEPLLAGIDFYRRVTEIQKRLKLPGTEIINGIQTNGTLLNEEWCRFFKEENFYIGVSIDGDEDVHNSSRSFLNGAGSFKKTLHGYELLRKYDIRNEILCVVNSHNSGKPVETYNFLKSLGAVYLTFLPLVKDSTENAGESAPQSVNAVAFGDFLIKIFDEWIEKDIGVVQIQIIEEAVNTFLKNGHSLCIFKKECGRVPVVEADGSFYACDHFVRSEFCYGNITRERLGDLIDSDEQVRFGKNKYSSLPQYCLDCEVLTMCYGECPKNRIIKTPVGEPGLNYLCNGYRKFFNHVKPFAEAVAEESKRVSG